VTLLLIATLGCTAGTGDSADIEVPTLRFLAPSEGEQLAAGDVQVALIAEHVVLARTTGAPALPGPWLAVPWSGTAHAHEDESTPSGTLVLSVDGSEGEVLDGTTTTLSGLASGDHTLEAALTTADGDAWDPQVTATVNFSLDP